MSVAVLPLHLGALHPYEQALTFLLAFGPFVVLALVLRRRNADLAAEDAAADAAADRAGESSPSAAVAEADSEAQKSASRTATTSD